MMHRTTGIIPFFILVIVTAGCVSAPIAEEEKTEISRIVEQSITWALNKDVDLLYSLFIHEPEFFIYHPDDQSTIIGWDAFDRMVQNFFMLDEFKATHSEVKNLRVHLSRTGKTAWFSAKLDDHGEFRGEPIRWKDVRWTGVLDKREGRWKIVQMHFSFPTPSPG